MRLACLIAVHVFLLRGQQVLLLRRHNTGYEDGNFSVVAGHLDGGETVTQAAVREAEEEVGVMLNTTQLKAVGVMHRRSDSERIDFFVATRQWSGVPTNCEPHKCSELRWSTLNALPSNTIPYVRRALENYQRGVWFDEFGW